ncbi:hypothetical protein N7456_004395 [Penicillium angulare]|uniref:Eukaryotic translation initiation factor 5A n=1 Tax=Penicillium angulare TaxID=116970 RepID=A0A9W9FXB0_9EURO|nr:hypothetical protein N7456_004395 [Penicillium angulare]
MSDDDSSISQHGQSLTESILTSRLRKTGHMVINGRPCKIVKVSSARTGKHGQTKIHFLGIDIFTGRKFEDIVPSTNDSDVPIIHRKDCQLVCFATDGAHPSFPHTDGNTKNDVAIPEHEIGQKINSFLDNGDSANKFFLPPPFGTFVLN